MHGLVDRDYLRSRQYKDASNLDARIALHARFSTNAYGWQRWLFDQIDLPATARILELGCGSGRLWCENRERIPPQWAIALTDFSPGMLDAARWNLSDGEHKFTYQVADVQDIPYKTATFEAVLANHMLYHVPDRQRALAEIRRVLKPGGYLYAATSGPRSRLGFRLEDGAPQLASWFDNVAQRRYDDALQVTAVGPLIAYIRSEIAPIEDDDPRLAELARQIEAHLARQGTFNVTKSTGVFIAA
jgi:ubiquinone/menaquinone biosynthesis C-methylase UbiE